jgi:hypothetical protein
MLKRSNIDDDEIVSARKRTVKQSFDLSRGLIPNRPPPSLSSLPPFPSPPPPLPPPFPPSPLPSPPFPPLSSLPPLPLPPSPPLTAAAGRDSQVGRRPRQVTAARACMRTHARTHARTHTCSRMHARRTHTCTHADTHTNTHTHTHICAHVRTPKQWTRAKSGRGRPLFMCTRAHTQTVDEGVHAASPEAASPAWRVKRLAHGCRDAQTQRRMESELSNTRAHTRTHAHTHKHEHMHK